MSESGSVTWPSSQEPLWQFDWMLNDAPDEEGIAISRARFRGHTVFFKASLPIVRVKYDGPGWYMGTGWYFTCGPYKDPLNFDDATTTSQCPHQRVCISSFTSNGFRALEVGAYYKKLLTLGMYHLYQRWIFWEDGQISARLSSKGLNCDADHSHHTYWRFDFDIDGSADDVIEEYNDIPPPPQNIKGNVILFEHMNFRGAHKHVFVEEPNLDAPDDNFFNDRTSSIFVGSGNWVCSRDANFANPYPVVLTSGLYPWVRNAGIQNDDISSLQPVTAPPTSSGGERIEGHIILFEHENFHGAHKHIFRAEPDLNAPEDNFFNDRTSSIAVLGGDWAVYRDSNFGGQFPQILGTGLYPSVAVIGIEDDAISSLRPVPEVPTVIGDYIDGYVTLFEHANFRGEHKHIFRAEPNLDAPDDNSFNDVTSSAVVFGNTWAVFRHANFNDQFPQVLMPGIYPSVEAVGITNDEVSSLQSVATPSPQSGWTVKPVEFSSVKNPVTNRAWRVRDKLTGRGYHIIPGPHDGIADSFSNKDIWAVRFHQNEDRSGRQGDEHDDALATFVDGENIDGQDIVVWYCGHLFHHAAEGGDEWHEVGPDLVPLGDWS